MKKTMLGAMTAILVIMAMAPAASAKCADDFVNFRVWRADHKAFATTGGVNPLSAPRSPYSCGWARRAILSDAKKAALAACQRHAGLFESRHCVVISAK